MIAQAYRDYGYRSPDPGSGDAGRALAARFVALVQACGTGLQVCDLGCGNGYLASLLGQQGHDVTGVDASESGIALARTHYQGDHVRFVRAELDAAQPIGDPGSYDVVVSSDVVEHLYRPAALVETAHLLLKPGGTLIIGTPYHGWLKNVAIAALGKWDGHHAPLWDGGHIKFFSVATLTRLVEQAGFRVRRFHYHGRAPYLWKNMICVAIRDGA